MTTRVPLAVPNPQISPSNVSSPATSSSQPRTIGDVGWEQLHAGIALPIDPAITIPRLTDVQLPVPAPAPVGDVEAAAREEVVGRLAGAVTDGMTVAVGAGSRGLAARVELLRGAIAGLRDLGAAPFVVPAMGSHGGATAEGQLATLEKLGMTADALDAEIRSSMETVVVAHDVAGRPLHLDVHAAAADRILPVNRMKPHTGFRGTIESGCTKMAVVGFGKQPGAAQFHSSGARRDARPAAGGHRRAARDRADPRRRGVGRGAVGRRRARAPPSRPTRSAARPRSASRTRPASSSPRCRSRTSTC